MIQPFYNRLGTEDALNTSHIVFQKENQCFYGIQAGTKVVGKIFFCSKQNLNLAHARCIKRKLTKECCLHKREEITWSGNKWTLMSLDQHLSHTHRLDEIMATLNNNKDVIYLYFTF